MEFHGSRTLYLEHFVELQDENRYNAGRGAHINLKRAERARVTVSKIPGIVFFSDATPFMLLHYILELTT